MRYADGPTTEAHAVILAKSSCVLAGLEIASEAFRQLDPSVAVVTHFKDSDRCEPGTVVAEYRLRLSSPSWFMKALRENIARRSNQEDSCSGVFWDGRFKCRRLLDDTAILICGIYVDLNQIRAGETQSPEESTHTSAFDRIAGRDARQAEAAVALPEDERERRAPDGWLGELTLDERQVVDPSASLHSRTGRRASDKGLIPVSLDRYLELLDWTGREIRGDKTGAIPAHLAPILERLQIRSDRWIDLVTNFERWFATRRELPSHCWSFLMNSK